MNRHKMGWDKEKKNSDIGMSWDSQKDMKRHRNNQSCKKEQYDQT